MMRGDQMKNDMSTIKVLFVDDDPGDVELTMELLESSKVMLDIEVANNGIEALDKLEKWKEEGSQALPDMILLDLNMPKKDGRETLEDIKKDTALKKIPIVILTTSEADEDIIKSYNLGASCYITKPVGLEQFQNIVDAIDSFWFTVVRYPPKE
jgi:two-component system response regulator